MTLPAARRIAASLLIPAVAATAGCNPFATPTTPGDDDDAPDAGAGGRLYDEIPPIVVTCSEAESAAVFEITDETIDAAGEAWAAGADVVVLAGAEEGFDGTCVWLRRTTTGGTTRVELGTIRRFEPVVTGTRVQFLVDEAVYYTEETLDSTTTWTADEDADGRADQRGSQVVDASGATQTSTAEWLDADTGAPWLRASYSVTGDLGRLVRELIDPATGTTTVIDDFETPRLQGRCASTDDPRPPGDVRDCPDPTVGDCTPSYERYARRQLRAAAKKGDRCLRRKGVLPKGKLLAQAVKTVKLRCFRSACVAGQLQPGNPPEMHMNTDRIPEGATLDAAQQATLFHELLHTFEPFSHDSDTLLELARRLGRVPLVDQTYACEAYCFNDRPSACECAACLQRDARGNPVTACSAVCMQNTEPCCEEEQAVYRCTQAGLLCDSATECATGCRVAGRNFPCRQIGVPCEQCCN